MHQHNFWHTVGGSVSRGSIVDQHSLSTVLPASLNLPNTVFRQSVFYYLICKNVLGDLRPKLCSPLDRKV